MDHPLDATDLGIFPPSTVRIVMDNWAQEWPFECVALDSHPAVGGACVVIMVNHNRAVVYPYRCRELLDDRSWMFYGPTNFIVSAGPPTPPSSQ